MPNYEHQCTSEKCKHEWEETYSISKDPPKICPKCGLESAKRVISLGAKGIVELTGQDLVDSVKADAKKIQSEAAKDANKYANLIGPDRYHQLQTKLDRRGR